MSASNCARLRSANATFNSSDKDCDIVGSSVQSPHLTQRTISQRLLPIDNAGAAFWLCTEGTPLLL